MTVRDASPKEAAIVYRAWSNGWCPCCQGELDGDDEYPVKTIGEGVQMCGWCVQHEHDEEDIVLVLLSAIVRGRADNNYSVKLESDSE